VDGITYLAEAHRRLQKLFSECNSFEATRRKELARQINSELLVLLETEERVFYPALRHVSPRNAGPSIVDHAAIRALMWELSIVDVDDRDFEQCLARLQEAVNTHIQEAEAPSGILEQARTEFDAAELTRLTHLMLRVKARCSSDRQ